MLKNGYLEVISWINFVVTMVIGVIIRVLYNLGFVDRYMDFAGRGLMQYGIVVMLVATIATGVYDNVENIRRKRKLRKRKVR